MLLRARGQAGRLQERGVEVGAGDGGIAPGAGGDVGNESVILAYKAMTGKDV